MQSTIDSLISISMKNALYCMPKATCTNAKNAYNRLLSLETDEIQLIGHPIYTAELPTLINVILNTDWTAWRNIVVANKYKNECSGTIVNVISQYENKFVAVITHHGTKNSCKGFNANVDSNSIDIHSHPTPTIAEYKDFEGFYPSGVDLLYGRGRYNLIVSHVGVTIYRYYGDDESIRYCHINRDTPNIYVRVFGWDTKSTLVVNFPEMDHRKIKC